MTKYIGPKTDGENVATQADKLSLSSDTPDALTPDQSGAAGTAVTAARADHQHEILAASAGTITGTNAEGTSTSFARADHDHAIAASLLVPTGAVMPYAGSMAPTGWLLCDGSEQAVATYGALDTVLGTTYGSRTNGSGGAGSSHFRLPDLRGRAVFGRDNMGGTAASRITNSGSDNSGIAGSTLGASGGDQRLHQHTHTQNQHDHTMASGSPVVSGSGLAYMAASGAYGPFDLGSIANTTPTNQNAGAGSSQNMPPAIVLNYIIKT